MLHHGLKPLVHQDVANAYPWLLATLAAIGFGLWVILFLVMIRRNHRDQACGMPLIGICGTFVQCFIYSFIGPWVRPGLFVHNQYSGSFGVVWLWRVWLLLQGIVLVQYLIYHSRRRVPMEIPLGPLSPVAAALVLLALNFIGQWTFITFYHDEDLNQSDPAVYLLMSIGFVLLVFARPSLDALSLPVAWLKMVGTALIFTCTLSNPAASFGYTASIPRQVEAEAQVMAILRGHRPTEQGLNEVARTLAGIGFRIHEPAEGTIFRQDVGEIDILDTAPGHPAAWQWVPTAAMHILIKHPPTTEGLLAARHELERIGFRVTGPDMLYRSDVGTVDVIPSIGAAGPTWQWVPVPPGQLVADNQIRIQFAFPLFTIVASVVFDVVYIVVLTMRRRALRHAAGGAASRQPATA